MPSLLFKTAVTAIVKAVAAIVALALTAVITRTLGAGEAGLFLFGFTLLSVMSVYFRLGLDNVVLRLVGAEGISLHAQQRVNRGLLWIGLAVLPFVVVVSLLANPLASIVLSKPEFSPVLRWMILALPAMTLFMLLGFAFQGLHRVILATVYQNLGLSLLFIILFASMWVLAPEWVGAESAALLYAICALVVCMSALWLWYRQPGVHFRVSGLADPGLWSASSNLWVASSMSLLVQWSGVLVAGAYVASEQLAYLTAAQRTAMLTSFVLMVVNMVVAPRYAKLWQEQNLSKIHHLAKLSTRGMIVVVLPVVAVMVIWPEFVMGLFGAGFEQGALLLTIMALGQLVNVATGSVGYLLNMSGHERDFRKVTMFAGPLTIVCAVLFTSQWGAVGAASATALGLSVQNLGALWMVKKRLGFWPIG